MCFTSCFSYWFVSHLPPSLFLPQFKLPTSAPHTTKPVKVTTPPVTMTTTSTTPATPVTVATTKRPNSAPVTTAGPEPTTSPTTTPPPVVTTPPLGVTTPPPGVTTPPPSVSESAVIRGNAAGSVTSPAVAMVTTDTAPVTGVLSGYLDPVIPLIIPPPDPDSFPLDVVTTSPPSVPHKAKEAISMAEPPTPVLPGLPLPTLVPVGQPDSSESSLYLDLTQNPSPGPPQDSQTEAGRPNPDEVPLWPKEETDTPIESAVQPENETATFSAFTVLSGDGEVDRTPPSFPHLLNTNSEPDYQDDPADAFLPVSSANSSSFSSSLPCQAPLLFVSAYITSCFLSSFVIIFFISAQY